MKITKIDLTKLHNGEHYQFQSEFQFLIAQTGAQVIHIETLFATFIPLFNNEAEALSLIQKSDITEQLHEVDMERNALFRGFSDAVKSACNHFIEAKSSAAKHFSILLEKYGNVAQKSYDQETADITNLVKEIVGTYLNDINLLGLMDWVSELNAKNQEFDTLMQKRYTQEADKTELRMKQVRTEVDAAYHDIVNQIDALILVNGSNAYQFFVHELNARVDKYNNIIAQRKGRNAKKADKTKVA